MSFGGILAAARTVPGPAPRPIAVWASSLSPAPSTPSIYPISPPLEAAVCPRDACLALCAPGRPPAIPAGLGAGWNRLEPAGTSTGQLMASSRLGALQPLGLPRCPTGTCKLRHVPSRFSSSFHFLLTYVVISRKLLECFFRGLIL